MKNLYLLLAFCSIILFTNAKEKDFDLKIKKQICYINEIPFVKWDCKYLGDVPCVVSAFASKENQITIKSYSYMKMGKVYENHVWVEKQVRDSYWSIKFLKDGKETFSNQSIRAVFGFMYKSKVFNEDGTLNDANVDAFINTYGETKPNVVIIN